MLHSVRTTLILDADVVQMIEDALHREHSSMKHVVNEALRKSLAPQAPRQEPYRLAAHESSVRPGFDPAGFNRLADELEDAAIMRPTP